jgi:hypothetical protein
MRLLKWIFGQNSTPELPEIISGLEVMKDQLLRRSILDSQTMEDLDNEMADNTETLEVAMKALESLYKDQQLMLEIDREAAAMSEIRSLKIGANISALLGE